jgi:hypothetical protein
MNSRWLLGLCATLLALGAFLAGRATPPADQEPAAAAASIQAFDSARTLLAEAERAHRWNEEDVQKFRAPLAQVTPTQRDDLIGELIEKRNKNQLPRTPLQGQPF